MTMRPKLRRYGRNRVYLDLDRPIPGKKNSFEKIPGVTTIVRAGLPKEVFARYAGTATADYAVNNWGTTGCAEHGIPATQLSALPPAERLAAVNKGRYEKRDAAGDRGREIHALAQELVRGAEVPVPDEIKGYVTAAVRFMDEFDVQPIAEELIVFSETHYYCGQLDFAASVLIPDLAIYDWIPRDDENRSRMLGDYKSGGSGIYGELSYQLAPYRFADFAIEGDEITPVPEVDFGAGVHLRPDGSYSVIPVEIEREQFDDFLRIKDTAEVADRVQDNILTEITPPLAARHRLIMTAEGATDV